MVLVADCVPVVSRGGVVVGVEELFLEAEGEGVDEVSDPPGRTRVKLKVDVCTAPPDVVVNSYVDTLLDPVVPQNVAACFMHLA